MHQPAAVPFDGVLVVAGGDCGVLLSTDSNTLTLDSDCWVMLGQMKKPRPGR